MVFLDITWGETFVLTGLGFALIGRKDLPKAAHFLGSQVGRVVGFLQGVRVRADKFTQHEELRVLHNELRSGLRELDAVRFELATAASSRGLVGRGLQSASSPPTTIFPSSYSQPSLQLPTVSTPSNSKNFNEFIAQGKEDDPVLSQLAPRLQSVAAVAEVEWEKQGIGFRSKAEMGLTINTPTLLDIPHGNTVTRGSTSVRQGTEKSGSMLLAEILQESLIFDQYDRTIREQDQIIQKQIDDVIVKRIEQQKQHNEEEHR